MHLCVLSIFITFNLFNVTIYIVIYNKKILFRGNSLSPCILEIPEVETAIHYVSETVRKTLQGDRTQLYVQILL